MHDLERAHASFSASAWSDAYDSFAAADEERLLDADDVEHWATAAYMLGREDEWISLLERAFQRRVAEGGTRAAIRCAFWIGMNLALRGEMGPATGWLGRAQRLLEHEHGECAERGYLLLPVVFEHEASGDYDGAAATAATAAEIGERLGDRDLFALAGHTQGEVLLRAGRVKEGLALLDEAMVAVTAGEVSPVVTGIVYCGVILACESVYELSRAQQWTDALTRWCDRQPDLLAFTGRCLVHRAQLRRLDGSWQDALDEARRAGARFVESMNRRAAARASYLEGEVHRLRGDFEPAERAYREASAHGLEPQPGLALLRLAQGNAASAAAMITRALAEVSDRSSRASMLPAYVEIMIRVDETAAARKACAELAEIAGVYESVMLHAAAAQARGAVALAAGDAREALTPLREAARLWQDLEAPYETAQTRLLLGLACRAHGDSDGGALELDVARAAFADLGAVPDVEYVDSLVGRQSTAEHGLSGRELEVLRHLAAGKTNREIAAELVISEHTVARHVQNILTKLRVTSRTAASAYAFEHDLV